jgi:hypothetical protein
MILNLKQQIGSTENKFEENTSGGRFSSYFHTIGFK